MLVEVCYWCEWFSLDVVRRPKPKRSKVGAQNPVKVLSARTDIQQSYHEQKPILSPQAVKQSECICCVSNAKNTERGF